MFITEKKFWIRNVNFSEEITEKLQPSIELTSSEPSEP
jgi:hypothetical protein